MKITNAKNINWGDNYGPRAKPYFWFNHPHQIEYKILAQLELYCAMEFSHFPFDKHICSFEFGANSHSITWIVLKPPIVLINNFDMLQLKDPPKRVEQIKLPFNIDVKVMEPFIKLEDGFKFSYSGMIFQLQRKSIGVLKGEFYLPTSLFSSLSILSYFIKPENVS